MTTYLLGCAIEGVALHSSSEHASPGDLIDSGFAGDMKSIRRQWFCLFGCIIEQEHTNSYEFVAHDVVALQVAMLADQVPTSVSIIDWSHLLMKQKSLREADAIQHK